MQHRLRQGNLLPATGGNTNPRNGSKIASVSALNSRPHLEHILTIVYICRVVDVENIEMCSEQFFNQFDTWNKRCGTKSLMIFFCFQDTAVYQHSHSLCASVLHVPFLHQVPSKPHFFMCSLPCRQS